MQTPRNDFPFDNDTPPSLTPDLGPGQIERALDELGHLDRAMRDQAVRQLVADGAAAVPLVIDYLQDDYNQGRALAAYVLGRIGAESDDQRLLPLLRRLLNDQDEVLRARAAEALGNLGDPAAIPALQQALLDNKSRIREQARLALQKLGAPQDAPPTDDIDPSLLDQHAQELRSRPAHTRDRASRALVAIGPAAVPTVLSMLTAREAWARKAAADVLRQLEDPRALEALRATAAKDRDPLVREAARAAVTALENA